MEYEVKIDAFEGPLDLLLHLIKESKVDIWDIKIVDITDQYLKYIKSMQELNLNVASEYLVMASELIEIKSTKIEKCLADNLIRDYTIEVHGLKNTARMIGAMELSDEFFRMEQLGNKGDVDTIKAETPALLEHFRSYKTILEPYGKANDQEKRKADNQEIIGLLEQLQQAMDGFDLDAADEIMKQLDMIRIPDAVMDDYDNLRAYVADVAMEEVMSLARDMIRRLV